jgi:hypothetical protein
MRGQHLGDERPTRPKPMITTAGGVAGDRRRRRPPTGVDPARRHLAELGEQGRDGEADRGDDLPEGGGVGLISCAARRRAEHDQRGLGRRGHEHAGFGRDRPARAAEAQQQAGHRRLDQQTATSASASRLCQLASDDAEIDAHPDGDQEDAEAEPAEGRGDHLDLAAIVGLGDQDAGDQRAEHRRKADAVGGEAGDDHHQQAGRQEQLGALGPRRLGEQAGSSSRPSTSIADDGRRRRSGGADEAAEPTRLRMRRHRAEQEDDRDQRQILEQQHRQRRAADRAVRADQRQHQSASRTAPAPGRARSPSREALAEQVQPRPISKRADDSSAAPTPNTSRRIVHSRRNDSSSPIEKSSRTIPNSANGSIACGLEMVT